MSSIGSSIRKHQDIDSNAWEGKGLLFKGPNNQNNNGKHLEDFLVRNKNITLVNALPLREGSITRKRMPKQNA